MKINFAKYHGLGNDYLFLDAIAEPELQILKLSDLAISMSHRRFGPGSDGIVLFCNSHMADIKMRIFNPDGSEAESCGNALRCIGRICREQKYVSSDQFQVETLGGIVNIILEKNDPDFRHISVRMGKPVWKPEKIPVVYEGNLLYCPVKIPGYCYDSTCLSVGNPHCIIFLPTFTIEDVMNQGPLIENLPMFPKRINVGFCRIIDRQHIELIVWERSAGLTGACGTGATAAFAAAFKRKLVDSICTIKMPGGSLSFHLDSEGSIFMTGPDDFVYSGQFEYSTE
ncbi:diaminopimelate epimerase [bacterium]|nr:diaminopimelate epimerase [bacterium]